MKDLSHNKNKLVVTNLGYRENGSKICTVAGNFMQTYITFGFSEGKHSGNCSEHCCLSSKYSAVTSAMKSTSQE